AVTDLARPIRTIKVKEEQMLLAAPQNSAPPVGTLAANSQIKIAAQTDKFDLVKMENNWGWLAR
ncbi:MAG: hypothetical protein AB8G22_04105, partial [Saprospiraceae bacterium]